MLKVTITVLTLALSMPVIHAVLFGVSDIGEAIFYYWVFGIPTLTIAVPLIGFPLEKCIGIARMRGTSAIIVSTLISAGLGALIVSQAHGIIWQVMLIAATFTGIGGFTWATFNQIEQSKGK